MSAYHDHRLHVNITQAMNQQLEHVSSLRKITKAELVREGLRFYLDHQADVTASRKHFTKSFQRRLDHVDWQQSVILHSLMLIAALLMNGDSDVEQDMNQFLRAALYHSQENDLQSLLHNARIQKPKPPTD